MRNTEIKCDVCGNHESANEGGSLNFARVVLAQGSRDMRIGNIVDMDICMTCLNTLYDAFKGKEELNNFGEYYDEFEEKKRKHPKLFLVKQISEAISTVVNHQLAKEEAIEAREKAKRASEYIKEVREKAIRESEEAKEAYRKIKSSGNKGGRKK